jgi:hypothetical protein
MPLPQRAELCSFRESSPHGPFPLLSSMGSLRGAENMVDYRHYLIKADVQSSAGLCGAVDGMRTGL